MFTASTIDDYDGTQHGHDDLSDDDDFIEQLHQHEHKGGDTTTPAGGPHRRQSSFGTPRMVVEESATDGRASVDHGQVPHRYGHSPAAATSGPISGSPQVGTLSMAALPAMGRTSSGSFSAGLSRPSAAAARSTRVGSIVATDGHITSAGSGRMGSSRRHTVIASPAGVVHNTSSGSSSSSHQPLSSGYYTTQPVNAAIDMYGFLKTGEIYMRNIDTESPAYRAGVEKQREKWNTYLAYHHTVVRCNELKKLVHKGIPPELRGQMWQLLLNTKYVRSNYTADYYTRCVTEAAASSCVATMEVEKVNTYIYIQPRKKSRIVTLRRIRQICITFLFCLTFFLSVFNLWMHNVVRTYRICREPFLIMPISIQMKD